MIRVISVIRSANHKVKCELCELHELLNNNDS